MINNITYLSSIIFIVEDKNYSVEDTITKFTMMIESGLYMANPQLVGNEMVKGWVTIQKE